MLSDDTIVAISSAVGPAARMIVRMSGPDSFPICEKMIADTGTLAHASMIRVRLQLKDLSFPATLYAFRSPRSATGEDVIEIHLPGNPILAKKLLSDLITRGARQAEPGEFSARSYFNGRLDLSAAEGISAIISAQNQRELNAARQLLSGELSRRLRPIMDSLAQTLALVETGIDFAGEEITVLDQQQISTRIDRINADLKKLLSESSRFESLSHEPRIVLVGRPNAGKSTLLNALAGIDRAIVSPIAGTTRDALSAPVKLRRGIATLLDVAGLDELSCTGEVSGQMHAAALRAVNTADVILLVREAGDSRPEFPLPVEPHLRIRSKADLLNETSADLRVSALTGTGMNNLRDRLDEIAFGVASHASSLALNARHIRCVEEAISAIHRAGSAVDAELIALELREALDALGEILGSITPDDVLGRIFSKFCIGK